MLDRINALDPTEFENLTYDSVRAAGLRNLVWRTPGADGGRDIEGIAFSTDMSGHELIQKWYVECKHYSNSIDWATIYKKIAHADVHEADVLLLVTNNNPSPACETEITRWNDSRRRPLVRFWRGYNLKQVLSGFPEVAASYGLIDNVDKLRASVLPLSLIISKVSQAAYVRSEFDQSVKDELEVGSGLAELLSLVLANFDNSGKLTGGDKLTAVPSFEWLDWHGDFECWDEIGIRAVLPFLRFVLNAKLMRFNSNGDLGTVTLQDMSLPYSDQAILQTNIVAHWSKIEITSKSENVLELKSR